MLTITGSGGSSQGGDQTQQPQGGGGGIGVGAWVGIAASILTCITAMVSIWYKCCRKRPERAGKTEGHVETYGHGNIIQYYNKS